MLSGYAHVNSEVYCKGCGWSGMEFDCSLEERDGAYISEGDIKIPCPINVMVCPECSKEAYGRSVGMASENYVCEA